MSNLPYRPNVCMIIFNKEKKVLLGERHGNPGVFQFPQGGVEEDCSLEDNVYRELEEELGIEKKYLRIVKKLSATNQYDFTNPPSYAIGKWQGQTQTFWLVEFLGTETDIKLDTAHPEFMSYIWCSLADVRVRAEQRRVSGYEQALQEIENYFK